MIKKILNVIVAIFIVIAIFNIANASDKLDNDSARTTRANFGTDKQIGYDPADYDQQEPSVAVAGNGVIYVVWEDYRDGNWDIFFAKSADNGANWHLNEVVDCNSPQDSYQRNPAIAIDSNNYIYLAFEENDNGDWDIYYTKSMDGGATWSTQQPVHAIQDPAGTRQHNPSVSIDTEDNIYIVWSANTTTSWDIYLTNSINSGQSWSEQVKVNDDFGSLEPRAPSPSIDIDGSDNLYIVWEDWRQGNNDTYFTNSSDGGNTFNTNIQVNDGVRDSTKKVNTNHPKVQVNSRGDVYVVWEEERNSIYNVYFTKSLNHGQSFNDDVMVNSVIDKCYPGPSPSLALDNKGNIYVTWIDGRDDNHTYFAVSNNGGKSFVDNTQVDDTAKTPIPKAPQRTYSQLEKARPDIAVSSDDNRIYIVWADFRNDQLPSNEISENSDIYFDKIKTYSDGAPESVILSYGTVGSNYVELKWTLNLAPDFNSYLLYGSTQSNFNINLDTFVTEITERSTVNFNLTSLAPTTTYYYKMRVNDNQANYNDSNEVKVTTLPNDPPLIALNQPDGVDDIADTQYLINWVDSDPDDNATIELYYDQNAIEGGEIFITSVPQGEDSFIDYYFWNTTGIPNGQYFIKAVIIDSVDQTYTDYSSGRVRIHHGELIPPEVITTIPLDESMDVSVTTEISVIFNEEIDASTLNAENFYIFDSNSNKLKGSYTYENSSYKAIFTPSEILEYNENYTATITTGIKDIAGNALESSNSWWFITEPLVLKTSIIKGRIFDRSTGDIIPNAKLTFKGINPENLSEATGMKYQTISEEGGNYELEVAYGTYEVTVKATDYQTIEGLIINLTINLKSQNFYLTAPVITEFSWTDSDGDDKITVDEELKFTSNAIDYENDTLLFVWSFGDGSANAVGESVTHKYKKSGDYQVTLIVTDLNGGNTTNTTTIHVESQEFSVEYYIIIIFIIVIILVVLIFLYVRRKMKVREAREREAFRMVKFERALSEEEEEGAEEPEEPEELEEPEAVEVEEVEEAPVPKPKRRKAKKPKKKPPKEPKPTAKPAKKSKPKSKKPKKKKTKKTKT
ncbi:MAG: Ig-like domain-containing protein [Thermoplasmata archaeon]|nr:Ig-like domain-containing protein [Thermoplasmata archaeon]